MLPCCLENPRLTPAAYGAEVQKTDDKKTDDRHGFPNVLDGQA